MPISAPTLVNEAFAAAIQPDPDWTPCEWADGNGQLFVGNEKGDYRSSRLPFNVEILNRLHRGDPVKMVAVQKGSRLGLTTAGLMWIGSEIHRGNGPIIIAEPTQEVAARVSKTKLAPMLSKIAVLKERVAMPRSRDSSNAILYKEYEGGSLTLVGMNSGNPLREADAADLLEDEVDGYPGEILGEGDPCRLLERRTATFGPMAKIFKVSTPKLENRSRIQKDFRRGDQRRYFIPCPHCKKLDILTWDGIDRVTRLPGTHHRIVWGDNDPKTAAMACASCGKWVSEEWKGWMVDPRNGARWEATNPDHDDDSVTSYHLSTLYSPLEKWQDLVKYWRDAQGDPVELQTFINTILGETYEDRSQEVESDDLKSRREEYPAEVPYGPGILIASVDVQKDRLEVLVEGWGPRFEDWTVGWMAFLGDTMQDEVWWDLDTYLKREWEHESGRKLRIERVMIDSNYATDMVYRFCRPRERRALGGWTQRIFAVRGSNEIDKPIIPARPRRMKPSGALVYTICTHTAKDAIFQRLRIAKPASPDVACPGYTHFVKSLDDEFFDQLMGETKNRKTGRYEKTRARNEALDLKVYNLAGREIGRRELELEIVKRAERWSKPVERKKDAEAGPTKPKRQVPPRRRGWISSIRGR